MRRPVAVVGAGVIGLTVACCLQGEHRDVLLIDATEELNGASYGNAGSISPASMVPMALPGTFRQVVHWLVGGGGPLAVDWRHLPAMAGWLRHFLLAGSEQNATRVAAALTPLLHDAPRLYSEFLGPAAADRLIQREGSLTVFRSAADWRAAAFALSLRARNGIDWEEISGADLHDFDPGLRRDLFRGVYFPSNGQCTDPGALLHALMGRFRDAGGQFIRARVTDLVPASEGESTIALDGAAPVAASDVVVAAGAGSARLASELGDYVPLEAERGYHAMLEGVALRPRVPTMDAGRKIVVSAIGEAVRIAGIAEFVRPETPPDWARVTQLVAQAGDLFPGLAHAVTEREPGRWYGARPSTPDSLPVIGRSQRCTNVIFAFGHGHLGLTAAPMTASLVADLVARRTPAIDIDPYKPSRF